MTNNCFACGASIEVTKIYCEECYSNAITPRIQIEPDPRADQGIWGVIGETGIQGEDRRDSDLGATGGGGPYPIDDEDEGQEVSPYATDPEMSTQELLEVRRQHGQKKKKEKNEENTVNKRKIQWE